MDEGQAMKIDEIKWIKKKKGELTKSKPHGLKAVGLPNHVVDMLSVHFGE